MKINTSFTPHYTYKNISDKAKSPSFSSLKGPEDLVKNLCMENYHAYFLSSRGIKYPKSIKIHN